MSKAIHSSVVSLLAIALVAAACSKKEETPAEEPAEQPAAEAEPTPAAVPDPEQAPEPAEDFVRIVANHAQPKPDDPVKVELPTFEVKEVTYTDPNDLTGGSAVLVLDLAALTSGSDKRDAHLRSEAYLNTAKSAAATITISDVKKQDGETYTAKAKVDIAGKTVERDIEFEVIDKSADTVRVRGSHEFPRAVFGIGKTSAEGDAVADDLALELELTLPKTAG